MKKLFLAAALVTTVFASAAYAEAQPKSAGGMLVNASGMTLYTFDNDAPNSGKSVCNGACATNWPPVAASDGDKGSGDFSIITRDDGSKQWAFKGRPLYTFIADKSPGDTKGDNVKEVWHIAK